MFELSQLRCFVAAAEELHFGRAASRLNMTQSPLSRQIQLLERSLSVALLDRNTRSVKLTSAGKTFLIQARRIVRLTESTELATRRVAAGKAGSITLGFTAVTGIEVMPRLVNTLRAAFPDVEVVLREMVTREQLKALLDGQIDIGIVRPPIEGRELQYITFHQEPMIAILPESNPLSQRESVKLSDFDGLPLIMFDAEEARYLHDMVVSLFAMAGVTPNYVQHVTQVHCIIALVRAGVGVALVPASAAHLCSNGAVARSVVPELQKPAELCLVWPKVQDNPAVDPIIAHLSSRKSTAPNLKLISGKVKRAG